MNTDLITALRKRGAEISDEIINWRRTFHSMPELRMDTVKTEAQIIQTLKEIGITDIRGGVGGHGVCAVIQGGLPGKCLGIRADCDGLPIKEETSLPFASTNGNMHACGHDSHTAMALGAAKLLFENRHMLKGCIKLIFQPYEEGGHGAGLMIADDALKNPDVDAVIALHNHCMPNDDYIAGDVLATSEPTSANIYAYEAIFRGTTSHICLANTAKNAVHMACTAVAKIADMAKGDNETINAVSVVNGGTRNNIIPPTCTIEGSVRSFDKDKFDCVREQVINIIRESALEFGGEVEIITRTDLIRTKIDPTMYEIFCRTVNEVFPERGYRNLTHRELIGEDFAEFAERVPGIFFMLHTKPDGTSYPLHHPKFDVNESVLHKGSIVFAAFALLWQNE